MRNIILEESNLAGVYLKAGDTNRDGKINALDVILIRNCILGDTLKQG